MKIILLFSLIFCAVLAAYDKPFPNKVTPGPIPPFCQNCLDLVKDLKAAFKDGKEAKELKEIAHKFCAAKIPPQLKRKCHHKVERHWEKVMKFLEEGVDSEKMCKAFRLCKADP